MSADPLPEIVAHRGFSARAPENTLAALEAAIRAGVESVEVDVQTAACGTPVLFHDSMLGRTTNGVGPLGRRTLAQLSVLDAGSWFGRAFRGERIPTLHDALRSLRGRIGRVYLDIKGYREMEDLDRLVEIAASAAMAEDCVFVSGDWIVLNRFRSVAPEMKRAYLVGEASLLPEALDRAVVDEGSLLDVEVEVAFANPEVIQEALALGVEVMTWTVDETSVAARAWEAGITGITSNEVEKLMAWRASLS